MMTVSTFDKIEKYRKDIECYYDWLKIAPNHIHVLVSKG